MLLLHRRTSAQTQSSQHWTCEEEKWASWHEKNISKPCKQINKQQIGQLQGSFHHQSQTKTKTKAIQHHSHKKANKKTNMVPPLSTDKDKIKVISPQIRGKGNCKEKYDLTTNHRQRLPGWRLFRLGIGTTLDRVQSLYPERNYFVWFLWFISQPSAILWDWEVTILYNVQCTLYKHVLKRNMTNQTWRQTW